VLLFRRDEQDVAGFDLDFLTFYQLFGFAADDDKYRFTFGVVVVGRAPAGGRAIIIPTMFSAFSQEVVMSDVYPLRFTFFT